MNQNVENAIRDLRAQILNHKHGKLNDEEGHLSGEITAEELEQRLAQHDEAIESAKAQIEQLEQSQRVPSKNRLVFISYARKDGRDLALRIKSDLLSNGYQVWLDTSEIEGGASWSTEIEDAIEQCNVVVALLSHGSHVSEICRAEQLRSLRKGKPVIPVLVQPNAERPLFLEHLNYRDFSDPTLYEEMFELLDHDLMHDENIPLPALQHQTLIAAPPLPPHFIARSEELEFLRQTVIGDNTDSQIALTALRGMGGIGKSVLATALCYDEVIQAAFPDGIIWVTIGRDPGNITEQMKFIGMKLGDSPGYYTSERASIDRLSTLLAHKALLLILDDVWDAKHVTAFRIDAPRCRTLFTTRDGGIALTVGASEVRLGTLTDDQALSLLREWAERNDDVMPQIAERLGYLPLALKLAGARLREGMTGKDWLETFKHVSQMKLGRRSRDPHENLEVCFDLSVQQLIEEDQMLYHAIGVFPEDVAVPQSTVVKLWCQLDKNLSKHDAVELVIDLSRLALIDRNEQDETITLHDLLHDYTRSKLGDSLPQMHAELLKAYNPNSQPWWEIKHDGYLYFQLGYHLLGCDRQNEFIDLVLKSRDWMEAKFIACLGDIAFVDDIDLILRQFHDPLTAEQISIVSQLYILRQIINVRASVYTNDDLSTLVWLDREEEALNHARLRTDAFDTYTGLLNIYYAGCQKGSPNVDIRDEMLRALREIPDDMTRQQNMINCAYMLYDVKDASHGNVFREGLFMFEPSRANELHQLYQITITLLEQGFKDSAKLRQLVKDMSLLKQIPGELSITVENDDSDSASNGYLANLMQDLLRKNAYDDVLKIAQLIPDDNLQWELAKWFIEHQDFDRAFNAANSISENYVKQNIVNEKVSTSTHVRKAIFKQLAYSCLEHNRPSDVIKALKAGDITDGETVLDLALKLAIAKHFDEAFKCVEIYGFIGDYNLQSFNRSEYIVQTSDLQWHFMTKFVVLLARDGKSDYVRKVLKICLENGMGFLMVWELYQLMITTMSASGYVDEALAQTLNIDEQKIQFKLDVLPMEQLLEHASNAPAGESIRLLKRAEELEPENEELLKRLVQLSDTSETYREKLFQYHPVNMRNYAIEQYQQGNPDEGVALLQRYLQIVPNDIYAAIYLSVMNTSEDDEERYMRMVIDRGIYHVPALKTLGAPLTNALQPFDFEAIQDAVEYQERIGVGMGYRQRHKLADHGIPAYKSNRNEEARRLFLRAVDISPKNEQAWHWLSVLVPSVPDKIICLDNVLRINPKNNEARDAKGRLQAYEQDAIIEYQHGITPIGRIATPPLPMKHIPKPTDMFSDPFGSATPVSKSSANDNPFADFDDFDFDDYSYDDDDYKFDVYDDFDEGYDE